LLKEDTMVRFLLTAIAFMLALAMHARAQEPVPLDLSNAKEFRLVWKKEYNTNASVSGVLWNLCNSDTSYVLAGTSTQGFRWKLSPKLDTSYKFSPEQWASISPPRYRLDFSDKNVPTYIGKSGFVYGCSPTPSGRPLVVLDTVPVNGSSTFEPLSGDVDGDGYIDVVFDHCRYVVFGGPDAGRGAERTVWVPTASSRDTIGESSTYISSRGGGRRVFQEWSGGAWSTDRWIKLYAMDVVRDSGGRRRVELRVLDSLHQQGGLRGILTVADTVEKRDYVLIGRVGVAGVTYEGIFVESFDVTDGTFRPTGQRVAADISQYSSDLTHWSLKPGRACVLLFKYGIGRVLFDVTEITKPLAVLRTTESGKAIKNSIGNYGRPVFIPDQYGDGLGEMFLCGGGSHDGGVIALFSTDSSATTSVANEEPTPSAAAGPVRLVGTTLEVEAIAGGPCAAWVVLSDGRQFPIAHIRMVAEGTNRFDVGPTLAAQASGPLWVRVMVDGRAHVVGVIQ
jgi:hypothetical protein